MLGKNKITLRTLVEILGLQFRIFFFAHLFGLSVLVNRKNDIWIVEEAERNSDQDSTNWKRVYLFTILLLLAVIAVLILFSQRY